MNPYVQLIKDLRLEAVDAINFKQRPSIAAVREDLYKLQTYIDGIPEDKQFKNAAIDMCKDLLKYTQEQKNREEFWLHSS